jgi:cyclopropane-fatty-acyl-phospholipid synthase
VATVYDAYCGFITYYVRVAYKERGWAARILSPALILYSLLKVTGIPATAEQRCDDMNRFDTRERYDRVVSIEMFEHMRNYATLLEKIHRWTNPGGTLFMHVFAPREFAYPFDLKDFTDGLMPRDDLLPHFQDHLRIRDRWVLDGTHYQKTAEAWLARMDARRSDVQVLFAKTYGEAETVRWRVFLMACADIAQGRSGS